MKTNYIFYLLLFFSLASKCAWSQTLTAPVAEGVYGGQIMDIETWSFDTDSVYVLISTQSANSVFYSKAYRAAPFQNLKWNVLPSAGNDDGYGSEIRNLEVHHLSNTVFFLYQGGVYQTDFSAPTATKIDSLVKNFMILGDTMFVVKNNPLPGGQDTLEFGPISTTGLYTSTNGMTLSKNYTDPPKMVVNPSNSRLSLFQSGSTPHLYTFQDPWYAMNNATGLASAVNPAPVVPNIEWSTYGFAQDGTWYVAGQPPLNNPTLTDRRIAWSTDNGFSWNHEPINTPGPQGGVVGNNMLIEDLATKRQLFIGNAILTDTSAMNVWDNPGRLFIGNLNRANDGTTKKDALRTDLKYHSTNVGFGYSTHSGDSIFGWNKGIEAVQVNDIDMNASFTKGWVASKSGIRKVTDYNTASESWGNTYFPNRDGSPYKAVGMDPNDDSTIFVGNQRIYRTTNDGARISSTNDGWSRVFTPEAPPYNFNAINTECSSIEVSPDSSEVVVAGYRGYYGHKGGVFYSLDGGNTWSQLLLLATTFGQDVNVLDVEYAYEGGRVILYIGIESDPVSPGQYGLFRAVLTSVGWIIARDGSYGATDGIVDIQINAARDTLVFLNTDPGLLPVNNVQVKEIATGTWSSHFGPNAGGYGSAITLGDGYLFMSINEEIYTIPADFSTGWTLAYAYPVGTEINVLFYDELLVGTGTGLYAHDLDLSTVSISERGLHSREPITMYPNPASNVVHFSEALRLEVYTLSGKKIYVSEKPEKQITVAHWKEGIYMISTDQNINYKLLIRR